ncbi:MAG TPA: VCBS repeat-containing protein, partial [Gemmatimonadaceae bacterium]
MSCRSSIAITLAAAAALACKSSPKPTPAWHQEVGYRWRDLDVPTSGTPGFTKMDPAKTGIRFQNFVSDSVLLGNRILGQGAGTCLGDVDGDGRVDVFLARTEGSNKLYRNLGDWRF